MSLRLELEDAEDQISDFVELHNTSIKAVEAVLTKMGILSQDVFVSMFITHAPQLAFIRARMQERLEGLIQELFATREVFLKKKMPKIKRTIEKYDAAITDGSEPENSLVFKLSNLVIQIEDFKFPDVPAALRQEVEILSFTKALHFLV